MQKTPIIDLKKISKKYTLHSTKPILAEQLFKSQQHSQEYWALKNVNLKIYQGDRVGFFGPNGAGKTTLLKIISHITQPTSGSIAVRGTIISLIELTAGFDQELSGLENIKFQLALLSHFSNSEIKGVTERILAFSELKFFIDQPLYTYSSGMTLRLAFSIATVIPADIFIVDEFFSVGDNDFKAKCFDYFNQLRQTNKTIIASSHDLSWLISFCSKIYPISHGHINTHNTITPDYLNFYRRSIQKHPAPIKVVTSSMVPTIKPGQHVSVQNTPFKQIQCGDIIAFMFANYSQPIIHRVIAKGRNNDDPILITKGDASLEPDSWLITQNEYIGKISF